MTSGVRLVRLQGVERGSPAPRGYRPTHCLLVKADDEPEARQAAADIFDTLDVYVLDVTPAPGLLVAGPLTVNRRGEVIDEDAEAQEVDPNVGALATLWGLYGGECDHGVGAEQQCDGCAEDDDGLNEIRPTISAALRRMDAA